MRNMIFSWLEIFKKVWEGYIVFGTETPNLVFKYKKLLLKT